MIFVNNEKLDLKDSKEFREAKAYFDQIGYPVRFKVKKNILSRDETEDGKVFMIMPTYYIGYTSLISTGYGTEQWRYSPSPPYEKNGELHWSVSDGKFNKKIMSFTQEQLDLAFFLWYKSKVFKSIYDIDDAKAEADAAVRVKMDSTKLDRAFYSEDSILQTDEEKLKTIARAYNVPQVDKKTKNQAIVALEQVVRDQVQKKVFTVDEFLESLSLDTLTELSAKIQKAEDDKLITYDDKQNAWFYVNEGGSIGEFIVQVPVSKIEQRHAYLRDFFMANTKNHEEFEGHVSSVANKALDIDLDNLESLSWTKEILPFISAVGIQGTGAGRNKSTVYKEIREKCS